jgi:hypothetical protein
MPSRQSFVRFACEPTILLRSPSSMAWLPRLVRPRRLTRGTAARQREQFAARALRAGRAGRPGCGARPRRATNPTVSGGCTRDHISTGRPGALVSLRRDRSASPGCESHGACSPSSSAELACELDDLRPGRRPACSPASTRARSSSARRQAPARRPSARPRPPRRASAPARVARSPAIAARQGGRRRAQRFGAIRRAGSGRLPPLRTL